MAICFVCGNDYAKSISVTRNGETFDFDCFECAIQALAPTCCHCGCKVIGHGVECDEKIYCCEHCARMGPPVTASQVAFSGKKTGRARLPKDTVQEASEESFPASDPPAWSGTVAAK
jgi:hypothetical protein